MCKILLLTVMILSLKNIYAQAPEIEWQNTIGGNAEDRMCCINQTADGGYVIGAYSASSISGDKTENSMGDFDYWIIKLNSIGEIVWQNTIGGSGADILTSFHQTSDQGFLLGGYSTSPASGDKSENSIFGTNDYWVVKLDSLGNLEWENTIGGAGNDEMQDAAQTTDGGFILGGRSDSPVSGDKSEYSDEFYDFWVVKLDSAGNIIWDNTIGGSEYDYLYTAFCTIDNKILIGGMSSSPVSGDKTDTGYGTGGSGDYWVLKLDNYGNIVWQNAIGGNDADWLSNIGIDDNGNYVLSGYSDSDASEDKTEENIAYYDYWTVLIDTLGNVLWDKTIGGDYLDIAKVQQNNYSSGYVLSGNSNSDISGDKTEANVGFEDYWIVKLDNTGGILWQRTLGGLLSDYMTSMNQTIDEGYIVGGYSFSPVSGNKMEANIGAEDLWIIKLEGTCLEYTFYADNDGDGYGNDIDSLEACDMPFGYAINNLDCDDNNNAVFPGAPEIENDMDDNCNGEIDEGFTELQNFDTDNKFLLYPNPTLGIVSLLFNESINTYIHVYVIDLTGNIVINTEMYIQNFYEFDAYQFSEGIYYIIISTEKELYFNSFIKL